MWLLPILTLGGCTMLNGPVLSPHGRVALTERNLMLIAFGAMTLLVIIPLFAVTIWTAWRFRANSDDPDYEPWWTYSRTLDIACWIGPAVIVGGLAFLVWTFTRNLDPYRPLRSAAAPLPVEAIAEDWKWIFIYPNQNIATINQLEFPSNRPIRVELTSDTVMNAFYVPGLGGQIFAMAGMRTRINLSATGPHDFEGENTQFSGAGFPQDRFAVRAVRPTQFRSWVARVKRSPLTLNMKTLRTLEAPSVSPVVDYSSVSPRLFARVLAHYRGVALEGSSASSAADHPSHPPRRR